MIYYDSIDTYSSSQYDTMLHTRRVLSPEPISVVVVLGYLHRIPPADSKISTTHPRPSASEWSMLSYSLSSTQSNITRAEHKKVALYTRGCAEWSKKTRHVWFISKTIFHRNQTNRGCLIN